ncbi:hypothetical protein ABC383_02135 [Noviherbaspirillum sp. 1P10PC]|uniref:hypothetical protein n=1 Tax=Noviherbaspirillum sp. 1P10PC TaxID=3132292 RepID=UPI0039A123D5
MDLQTSITLLLYNLEFNNHFLGMNKRTVVIPQPSSFLEQYKTFSLRRARDQLLKLEWDIAQLQTIPSHTIEHHYQAINCAIAAWQMCDWVYAELNQSMRLEFPRERKFRDHIKAQCHWLKICRELADASKHRHLTDSPSPDISTLTVDVYVTPSGEEITQMFVYDGQAIYSTEQVMWGAHDFWEQYCDELVI